MPFGMIGEMYEVSVCWEVLGLPSNESGKFDQLMGELYP
jgi:hypothetical protein